MHLHCDVHDPRERKLKKICTNYRINPAPRPPPPFTPRPILAPIYNPPTVSGGPAPETADCPAALFGLNVLGFCLPKLWTVPGAKNKIN